METDIIYDFITDVENSNNSMTNEIFDQIFSQKSKMYIENVYNLYDVSVYFKNRTLFFEHDYLHGIEKTCTFLDFIKLLIELKKIKPLSKEIMKELEKKQKEIEIN